MTTQFNQENNGIEKTRRDENENEDGTKGGRRRRLSGILFL